MAIIKYKINHKQKCSICGKSNLWVNDIPLKYFCWGTEKNPHKEWTKLVLNEIITDEERKLRNEYRSELL